MIRRLVSVGLLGAICFAWVLAWAQTGHCADRYRVSRPQIKQPDMGRTGGQAALFEVRAWVEGPEDEATWCVGTIFRWPDGTKSLAEQDCPPWADYRASVARYQECDERVVVVPKGYKANWDCEEPFRQQRSWAQSRWFGLGMHTVIVEFVRGAVLARRNAQVIVPGGDEGFMR